MASSMRGNWMVILAISCCLIPSTYSSSEFSLESADCEAVEELQFNGTLANESVFFQTSLGPRTPGSVPSQLLRQSIKENLTGWDITESTHHVDGMVLTNLYATWNPYEYNKSIYLAAHYDTRDRAERDENESMRDKPIDGANDGASGVAVLIELSRHIPGMNLSHGITLFFTDGEDQGVVPSFLGARSWAQNLTEEEADSIESFILVDMVGDEFLTLSPTKPGNETTWNRTIQLVEHMSNCQHPIKDAFDSEDMETVYDDHIWPMSKGIPSIDIIDIKYGENASAFGGHWHTHNDTHDKVSLESLDIVGELVEFGLITGAWLDIRPVVIENQTIIDNSDTNESQIIDIELNDELEKDDTDRNDIFIGGIMICLILISWTIVIWVYFADNKGEG